MHPAQGQLLDPGQCRAQHLHKQSGSTRGSNNRQHSSYNTRAPAQRIGNIAFARPVQPLAREHLQVLRPPCLPPQQHCLGLQIGERVFNSKHVSAHPLHLAAPCPHDMDHSQEFQFTYTIVTLSSTELRHKKAIGRPYCSRAAPIRKPHASATSLKGLS